MVSGSVGEVQVTVHPPAQQAAHQVVERKEFEAEGDCLVARVRPAKGGDGPLKEAIFAMAVEKNLQITEMHSVEGRLDELFRQITARDV